MRTIKVKMADGSQKTCMIQEIDGGAEFTVCGNAWTDSTMESEGLQYDDSTISNTSRITCKSCERILKWFKSVEVKF